MRKQTKKLSAAVCALTIFCTAVQSIPQQAFAAEAYQVRDPFYQFGSGYHYYTSEHFQFIWGSSGDSAKVTESFLKANAANLETCWDIYVNDLGMTECAESVEPRLRDGKKYKLNVYISGTGLADKQDDWAYMSYDNQGFPYLFCCVDAMATNPVSWVMPHEFGHAITAHQLGWNRNKYSNTWWEALGNWFREQWIYRVSAQYHWENDPAHGYGTDFFETYLLNLNFTSPFGRDYYAAWVLMQYLTENPDGLEGYGENFVRTMLQQGKDDEYPLLMIDRLAPADINETLGHYAKRMATLDFGQQTAYRKRLDELLGRGAWYWQQIYTMPEPVTGKAQTFTVPTERAPQASGLNIIPLTLSGDTVSVTLTGRSDLKGADWRGCIVIEDANGKSHYSDLFKYGETGTLAVPADAKAAYVTVIATPDASLYCPSGLHWHQDSDEFGETKQPFSSKHRYPYEITIGGAEIMERPLGNIRGHRHANGGGFVADTAKVADTVYVGPDAAVLGYASVSGNAVITGHAIVAENAKVSGNALIGDMAVVRGRATVTDNARVLESACLWDDYTVKEQATAKGVAFCMAKGTASGQAVLDGDYYDDGSNTATKGNCCGWYGTQTYLDARPYTDGQYLAYDFDTDSSVICKERSSSTYALPAGCIWQESHHGAAGVMEFDGKDDVLPLDSAFGRLQGAPDYQLAALWYGGAANQALLYFGDDNCSVTLTPKNDAGKAALILRDGEAVTQIEAAESLTPGKWTVIRIIPDSDEILLEISGMEPVRAKADLTPYRAMLSPESVCLLGNDSSGNAFGGVVDFVRAGFKETAPAEETYPAEPEPVTEPEPQTVLLRGDVNCSGAVDVSDAVLLARFVAEDTEAVITAAGKQNADCDGDGAMTSNDTIRILRIIAKLEA